MQRTVKELKKKYGGSRVVLKTKTGDVIKGVVLLAEDELKLVQQGFPMLMLEKMIAIHKGHDGRRSLFSFLSGEEIKTIKLGGINHV